MAPSIETARAGTARDAVGGVVPREVVHPATVDELAAAMAALDGSGHASVARGNGTKQDFAGSPSALHTVVDVSALDRIVEFAPGDLVVRVEAGMRLDALQAALARHGLRVAVDEVVAGSTVGGMIATGLAGPIRYGYGAVRDLLIGVTVVRADGTIASAGGKVVKNVAGYDLCKLYTGSYGTLGVIARATFRLHPVPQAQAYLSVQLPAPAAAAPLLRELASATEVPAAVEIDRPAVGGPITVTALLEGSTAGVRGRVATLGHRIGPAVSVESCAPPGWGRLPGTATIRLTSTIDAVCALADDVDEAARTAGVDVQVQGSAGGLLQVGIPDGASAAPLFERCREAAARHGGFGTLLRGRPGLRSSVDAWGPVPGLALMRAVKNQFDPDHRLSPGRFVGGI